MTAGLSGAWSLKLRFPDRADNVRRALKDGEGVNLECRGPIPTCHGLRSMQIDIILAGGLINWRRKASRAAA